MFTFHVQKLRKLKALNVLSSSEPIASIFTLLFFENNKMFAHGKFLTFRFNLKFWIIFSFYFPLKFKKLIFNHHHDTAEYRQEKKTPIFSCWWTLKSPRMRINHLSWCVDMKNYLLGAKLSWDLNLFMKTNKEIP